MIEFNNAIKTENYFNYNASQNYALTQTFALTDGDRSLKSMGEKLLEQDIPDQEGAVGRLHYSLKGYASQS